MAPNSVERPVSGIEPRDAQSRGTQPYKISANSGIYASMLDEIFYERKARLASHGMVGKSLTGKAALSRFSTPLVWGTARG